MKLLVTVLFLTGFSLAQTKADFSGIFLRTRSEVQGHPEPQERGSVGVRERTSLNRPS